MKNLIENIVYAIFFEGYGIAFAIMAGIKYMFDITGFHGLLFEGSADMMLGAIAAMVVTGFVIDIFADGIWPIIKEKINKSNSQKVESH